VVVAALNLNRDGIELRAEPGDDDVLRLLTAVHLPQRPRRTRRGVTIGFHAASMLIEADLLGLHWEDDARSAVENRARVYRNADTALAAARHVQALSIGEVRETIADSPLSDLLDDHQARNVAVMTLRNGWGTCVFDEQGTGKTITTIAAFDVLAERGEADILLVAAPKSMVGEWQTEIRKFAGDLYGVAIADGTRVERARAIESGADVVVFNYETAVSLAENLSLVARRSRAVLVVDESFAVKNPDARRSAALADLRQWCRRAYVLCGTPAPNNARDIVAQFDLVDFGYAFATTKLDCDDTVAFHQLRDAMNQRGLYVRNLKRTVMPQLPKRTFTQVAVELAPLQAATYRSVLEGLIRDISDTSDAEFRRHLTSYLQRRSALLRICSNPSPLVAGYAEVPAKLDALDRLLTDLIEKRGEKVVVWSFYRASLDAIASRYASYGVSRIDGRVSTADRRQAVKLFQQDDSAMLFIGNPAAAGAGITLHRSRFAIYESLSNQTAHYLQSLDRIHRRGQDREVEYIALICRGTIEEAEYTRLLDKAEAQGDLLGDPPMDAPTRELLLAELLDAERRLDFRGT
jgi:SNF2 family DNA or RNA helicase